MKKVKFKDYYRSLLKEADSKVYVKKGQAAPKGKKIHTGPKGGQYFMGSAKEKQSFEKQPSVSAKMDAERTRASVQQAVSQKPTKSQEKETPKANNKKANVQKQLDKSVDDLTNSGKFQQSWYEGDMDAREIYDQSHDLASEVMDAADIDFDDDDYDDLYDSAVGKISKKIRAWVKSQNHKPTK